MQTGVGATFLFGLDDSRSVYAIFLEARGCVPSAFAMGEGLEHVAEVTAASLYEAGALALQQFRRSDWSREASLDAGTLRVEVREATFYNVKVAELEAWLKRTGGAPRDVSIRERLRTMLGG